MILFFLGLSICNKLTVEFLWNQGAVGSQSDWLTLRWRRKKKEEKKLQYSDFWVAMVMLPVSAVEQRRKRSSLTLWEMHTFLINSSHFHESHTALNQPLVSHVLLSKTEREQGLKHWGVKQSWLSFHCQHGNEICEHNTSLAFKAWRLQFHLNLNGEKSDSFSLLEWVKFCILQNYNNKWFDWTQQAETRGIRLKNVFKNF